MNGSFLLQIVSIIAAFGDVYCSEILGVFPSPEEEHFKLGARLMKELATKGHKVTVVSYFPKNYSIPNYIDIPLDSSEYLLQGLQGLLNNKQSSTFGSLIHSYDESLIFTEALLIDNNFQALLQSKMHYDVIILDYFLNDALIGFGKKFNSPVILLSSLQSCSLNNHLFANPSPPAYIPNIFTEFTGRMDFWDRASNMFTNSLVNFYKRSVIMPQQEGILRQWFGHEMTLKDVVKNVSLILLNSSPGITEPVPHMPNMIEVGGLHIEQVDEVPRDIVKFLDEANEGVILFTSYLDKEQTEVFVKTFARLNMKVLWKTLLTYNDLESEFCSGCSVPENIKLVSWLPQQNVLAHKNIKTFINNGDLFDIIDSAYFAIPMVGIPVTRMQKHNMALAVENKYAVQLDREELTKEIIIRAVDEVILNPQYKHNAELKSKILHDQETKPLEKAMFWIEYIIRHNGAKHLQSPGVLLSWYQQSMLDIIIVLTVIDIILFFIFYYIMKHIIHHIVRVWKKKKSEKYVKLME